MLFFCTRKVEEKSYKIMGYHAEISIKQYSIIQRPYTDFIPSKLTKFDLLYCITNAFLGKIYLKPIINHVFSKKKPLLNETSLGFIHSCNFATVFYNHVFSACFRPSAHF